MRLRLFWVGASAALALLVSVLSADAQNPAAPPETPVCNGQPCFTTANPGVVNLNGGTGATVTANQGTPAAVANAWPVELAQGGAIASVIASTAAATSGTNGLVVTLGPNSNGIIALNSNAAVPTIGVGTNSGNTNQVTVTTGTAPATTVVAARTGITGTGRKTVSVSIVSGTNPLFCGFTNAVTSSTGLAIGAAAYAGFSWDTQSAIYCVTTGGSDVVSYSETY